MQIVLPCSQAGALSDLRQKLVYHGVLLLQAEVDSWQSSRAATPEAVLLAVPSPGLPGASSRQMSGVTGALDHSWNNVLEEVELITTQRVK